MGDDKRSGARSSSSINVSKHELHVMAANAALNAARVAVSATKTFETDSSGAPVLRPGLSHE